MNIKRLAISTAIALVCVWLAGPSAYASEASRPPADWAFAIRSDVVRLPAAQAHIAATSPEVAAKSMGIARLIRPEVSLTPPPETARIAMMAGLEPTKARVVVDLEHGQVYIRRGTDQVSLPIEFRSSAKGSDAREIANAARLATSDQWIVPYGLIVDGNRVGVKVRDGETFLERSVLELEMRRQTLRFIRAKSLMASR
jgi:hypothetical protein